MKGGDIQPSTLVMLYLWSSEQNGTMLKWRTNGNQSLTKVSYITFLLFKCMTSIPIQVPNEHNNTEGVHFNLIQMHFLFRLHCWWYSAGLSSSQASSVLETTNHRTNHRTSSQTSSQTSIQTSIQTSNQAAPTSSSASSTTFLSNAWSVSWLFEGAANERRRMEIPASQENWWQRQRPTTPEDRWVQLVEKTSGRAAGVQKPCRKESRVDVPGT